MKLKADWQLYLRTLRTREITMIFGRCPQDAFRCGLELGAGDGFQSTLLAPYVCRLIATDFRPLITAANEQADAAPAGVDDRSARMEFMTCDAERVDEVFSPESFDLIFSSNMLEHLPDPARALRGMRDVLQDDGVAIHVVPSPFWKLTQLAGFYPNVVLSRLERRMHSPKEAGIIASGVAKEEWDNNPKVSGKERPYLARLLWPAAHGASGSNLREFALFSRRYWRQQFEAAGFRVALMQRGPVSSGYGFGLDRVRASLERLGLASETIYITVKAERPLGQPDRLRYFAERTP